MATNNSINAPFPIDGSKGGTGVNNGSFTATYAGNLSFANSFATLGNFPVTFTFSGSTSLTFPTSGTLATTSQIPSGTAITKTDDSNVTLTLGGSPTNAVLNGVSFTLGWNGLLPGSRGGTGVNNGSNTLTYAGNINFANAFTTSGNFPVTLTFTATTNVTFPTSGTLATVSMSNSTKTSNYTLAATDNGTEIIFNPASGTTLTLTVPKQTTAALSTGFNVKIVNVGLGDVTVLHEAGDIFEAQTTLLGPNSDMFIILDSAGTPNTWRAYGGTMLFPIEFTKTFDGTAVNGNFLISASLPSDVILTGAAFGASSGTGTATLNLNGANITNGALSITNTLTRQGFTGNNSGSSGQFLMAVLSSVSSLVNSYITVFGYRRF
jgi:hypothetical protein